MENETEKEVVMCERLEADQVLPPGGVPELPHTPTALSAQYRLAMDGLRECLKFGAMLAEVEESLDRSLSRQTTGQITGREGGLKTWLAANCPEVDYGWALKYKRLAEGVREACALPAAVPLSLAISEGEADGVNTKKLGKARAEVAAFLEGKTARQLEFAFGLRASAPKGGAREGAGRKRLTLGEVASALGADPELARKRLVPMVAGLRRACLDDDAFGALPDREVEALVAALSDVCRHGREILETRKNQKAVKK